MRSTCGKSNTWFAMRSRKISLQSASGCRSPPRRTQELSCCQPRGHLQSTSTLPGWNVSTSFGYPQTGFLGTAKTEQLRQQRLFELFRLRKTNVQSLDKMHFKKIMVVVFIILDWIFILMNTTTMIRCRRVSYRGNWPLIPNSCENY